MGIDDADDFAEFMERAGEGHPGSPPPLNLNTHRKGVHRLFCPDEDDSAVQREFCEWAKFGPGYIPADKSSKTLPPGIYAIEQVADMMALVPRPITTDKLLRLPDSKSDEVLKEIERFWTLKDKFTKHGYSHRRGFLLWGPPGGGKTATIAMIAADLVANGGIVVIISGPPVSSGRILKNLRIVEPDRPLVMVMEDIDAIIAVHGESDTLSLLDGEMSIDGCVNIASSNFPENLDGRIINRPSRFDRIVKIGMPNASARRTYIESRNLELSPEDITKMVDSTNDLSIAHIKELIVSICCFGNDFDTELKRMRNMSRTPKSSDGKAGAGFGM